MTQANPTPPLVSLFFGLLVSDESLFDPVESILAKEYSAIVLRSETIPFDMTDYYAEEMGPKILRRWVGVRWVIDADALATVKSHTNRIEGVWDEVRDGRSARKVNIDPGYLTPAKVVLASCKDRDHRIYLSSGVFAEVTLSYKRASKRYEPLPWTYLDYQTAAAQDFFLKLRAGHEERVRVPTPGA